MHGQLKPPVEGIITSWGPPGQQTGTDAGADTGGEMGADTLPPQSDTLGVSMCSHFLGSRCLAEFGQWEEC